MLEKRTFLIWYIASSLPHIFLNFLLRNEFDILKLVQCNIHLIMIEIILRKFGYYYFFKAQNCFIELKNTNKKGYLKKKSSFSIFI